MKKRSVYSISLLLFGIAICSAQEPKNAKLAYEIDSLYAADQKAQAAIISSFQNNATKEKMDEQYRRQKDVFDGHIPILKEIIHKHGFPTFGMVGQQASKNFFVLIQHADSDIEFQRFCLDKAKKFIKSRQVSTDLFAYLTDRVNINSGRSQIYGTQVGYDVDGNAFAKDLKDPKNVNKRRASVGLGTIEEYLKKVTELHKTQNRKN